MEASLIWYRARSGGELTAGIKRLMLALEAEISNESSTIDPKQLPQLLITALRDTDVVVIVGGMELMRESENTICILSRCLAVGLEEGEKSRSAFIFDTLRGRPLPTFETAVLYPSANGGPEGMSMTAGERTIILLPWLDHDRMDVITMMEYYLPELLGMYACEEPQEIESQPNENRLPEYIERAAAKHQAQAVKSDVVLSAEQLNLHLLSAAGETAPRETNSMPPVRSERKIEPFTETDEPRRHFAVRKRSNIKGLPVLRISAILMLLTVIFTACYVAFSSYEPGLLPERETYHSELSELFGDTSEADCLPENALAEFSALYKANNRVRGYISIPGTQLSLPIVQPSADMNISCSYLDFFGAQDARGTLYFDSKNNISYGSRNVNLIVYGNSPTDGSMFAELQNYTGADYFRKHQIIHMDTLYEPADWVVFSVCIVSSNVTGGFNYASTDFSGQDMRLVHLNDLLARSLFCTETEVLPTDDLLTLVTDSPEFSGAKLIVCARRLRSGEEPTGSRTVIANELVLMPDIWYDLNSDVQRPVLTQPEPVTTASTMRENITVQHMTDSSGNIIYVTEITTAPTAATLRPNSSQPVYEMCITSGGTTLSGSAEDILAMIIEAEMGSDYSLEALKAQCVASYTYYLYSGGAAKAPNFPTKEAGQRALEAARAVVGQRMMYGSNIPYTPYFDISAGRTADNSVVNDSELAYLPSVDCFDDENVDGFKNIKRVGAAEVAKKVLDQKGIDLNAIRDKTQWLTVLERDSNNLYVAKVSVGGTVYKGSTLQQSILGYTCLRSPCFWIDYDSVTDEFVFTSLGYGSGVGMSQSHANTMASQGMDYKTILQYFYPGTTIV